MNNNNCDWNGDNDCSVSRTVRKIPLSQSSNVFCCLNHFAVEMKSRLEKNKQLPKEAKFDLLSWSDLEKLEIE